MVPWTSFGSRCHHIPVLRKCRSPSPHGYVFPSSAFMAFIAVSIINIVLVVALGWYVLGCAADNCFTVFLPLFASAAPLGNWALYRVGLNVLSYVENWVPPPFPTAPAPPLTQFAYAIGFVSITALLLTFVIANGAGDTFVVAAASAPTLLYRHCNLHLCCDCIKFDWCDSS